MTKLTAKNIAQIEQNILNSDHKADILKMYNRIDQGAIESLVKDAQSYVKAAIDGRTICDIKHVARSGESRVMIFGSCEQNYNILGKKLPGHHFKRHFTLMQVCGYKYNRDHAGFNIKGCGMDMVHATHRDIIDVCERLGLITKAQHNEAKSKQPIIL